MTDQLETTPFLIDPSSTVGQLGAAGRYLLTAAGSYALAKGWITGDLLQAVTTIVTIVAPMAYGIWKTHQTKAKLIAVASAAPDSVAVVTG